MGFKRGWLKLELWWFYTNKKVCYGRVSTKNKLKEVTRPLFVLCLCELLYLSIILSLSFSLPLFLSLSFSLTLILPLPLVGSTITLNKYILLYPPGGVHRCGRTHCDIVNRPSFSHSVYNTFFKPHSLSFPYFKPHSLLPSFTFSHRCAHSWGVAMVTSSAAIYW